ncbi:MULTISPECIES: hypothetical protein [unclassified Methylobacterium]|uniref:hypothetical protein n=1 Tax=unclassified Methylobacterium TaxID=2615210 RepID=UPI001FB9EFAB|nr:MULTISPECIES: hypothetical protein [unclassified Methylobacterium]MCJ2093936.1 hypothetical protein [Methylobacterium sp. J-072]MCJ2143765.1 hypothetical protein [Methylobacterium sp. E-066]
MTTLRAPVAGFVLYTLSAGLACAQPDVTGTGGGPLSTETAPNTTAVGQTKPPSRDASPTATKPIERRTPRQAADAAISTRICIGCRPDPGTTGSLPGATSSAAPATVKSDVTLDELRTLATPRQQSDLDTLPLASAHREQARSAQEKTDGLWQSWLVSVCDGCGDQKPARALRLEDWPNREAAATAPADRRSPPTRVRAADIPPHRSLAADLSPENITGIRRMP